MDFFLVSKEDIFYSSRFANNQHNEREEQYINTAAESARVAAEVKHCKTFPRNALFR